MTRPALIRVKVAFWRRTPGLMRLRRRLRRPVDLSSVRPVSDVFGLDRGTPVDRFYVERFLAGEAPGIAGSVLEIGDATYTRRFGGSRVTRSDVLHAVEGNSRATLVGDLATGAGVPRDAFDCAIVTQTLQFVYDARAAVRVLHDALRPGGIALVTLPGISQISTFDMEQWGDFWRFTTASARVMFGDVFGADAIEVRSHGNVTAACALLQGLAAEELSAAQLETVDDAYQLIVTVKAVRSQDGAWSAGGEPPASATRAAGTTTRRSGTPQHR
jgi:SAM-dependent methyltransferase